MSTCSFVCVAQREFGQCVFLCINISVRALVSTLLTNVCVSVIKLLSSAQDSHLSLTSRNGVWQPVAKTIITQHTDSLYQSVLTRIKIFSELLLLKRSNYLHTKVGWGTKIWKKEGKFQLVSPPFFRKVLILNNRVEYLAVKVQGGVA